MKAVLRALLEIFPQIDLRILRTVAVEYPSDVDTAVEFILSDVLPIIKEPVETSYTHIVLDAERSLTGGQNLQVKDTTKAEGLPCQYVTMKLLEEKKV